MIREFTIAVISVYLIDAILFPTRGQTS